MEKDGRMVNRAPAPQVPDRNPALHSHQIAQIVDATPEQLDSIKKYQVNFLLFLSIEYLCGQIYTANGNLFLCLKKSVKNRNLTSDCKQAQYHLFPLSIQ